MNKDKVWKIVKKIIKINEEQYIMCVHRASHLSSHLHGPETECTQKGQNWYPVTLLWASTLET